MNHFLTLLLILCSCHLWSQHPVLPVLCGNEVFSDIIRKNYPALQEGFTSTFEAAKGSLRSGNEEPLHIKVVVHIVWKDPAENLHDSIILNQMEILNQDYNRLNADTHNLRAIFQAEAGRGNIHFELTEIVRVHTDRLFAIDLFGTNLLAEVKHTADGGSDAWDTESYLNIWITKIQPIEIFGILVGQILGFAFPPNGLDHWPEGMSAPSPEEDGVVLDYRVLGSNNPNTVEIPGVTGGFLTVKGRSATHEVGHYLGLRHIWGDGGLLGPNDCAQSDGIEDTPYADSQSAFDCDKVKNSCPQIETHYNQDMPDLIENFMDYAADDCMNMFTKGQVGLIRNVLLGPRSGLIEQLSVVNEINDDPEFYLSPNPAENLVTLHIDLQTASELSIRVADINGRLLEVYGKQPYNPGMHEIPFDMTGYAPGIYIVEMRTMEGIRVLKFMLK